MFFLIISIKVFKNIHSKMKSLKYLKTTLLEAKKRVEEIKIDTAVERYSVVGR